MHMLQSVFVPNGLIACQVLDELVKSKQENKGHLAKYIKNVLDIDVDVDTMFDIQVTPLPHPNSA